ncbi:HAD-IA family hydrolase [bacterium]|nr:HAD-IA family hydrolase [bacterium]
MSTITATIWDYDGTLVDTRQKNFNVAKKIVQRATNRNPEEFPAFRSIESYDLANKNASNWRDLYTKEFGLSEEETDRAGRLWTEYQLMDLTPTPMYAGIDTVIHSLHDLPQGIVSMNSKRNIEQSLGGYKILDRFKMVVGYEEVDIQRQKPEPDGLLNCLEKLTSFSPGKVIYIGDHETDVKCVRNTNLALRELEVETDVISVGAFYGDHNDDADWQIKPDYRADSPSDITRIIRGIA